MEEKPMELKSWFAVSWIAASFVTLVGLSFGTLAGLGIGALAGSKNAAPGGVVGFVGVPNCSSTSTNPDFARGDIAVPQYYDPTVNLDRFVCAGDWLRWHDQSNRPFSVVFDERDCTGQTSYPRPTSTSGGESVLRLPVQTPPTVTGITNPVLHCTYTLTVPGNTPPNFSPAHIIIMK
jgi:hypothetical protein